MPTIYKFYRTRKGMSVDEIENQKVFAPNCYAFTSDKKIAKEFERIHDMSYFNCIKKKYSAEEVDLFKNRNTSRKLIIRDLDTSDLSERIYSNSYTVPVPITEFEKMSIDSYRECEVERRSIETPPSIFKPIIYNALDMLLYNGYHNLYYGSVYRDIDDDVIDCMIDELNVFIGQYDMFLTDEFKKRK